VVKASGKFHPFLASSSAVGVQKQARHPTEHSPLARQYRAQDHPSQRSVGSRYLIWPICQLAISTAEDDMIKEMGMSINYFL